MDPNAVPISIAASEMKSRARPNNPTSAIASAAGANGRLVEMVGMMPHASNIQPNTMYGVNRKIGLALWATTLSLWNSLCNM